MEAQQIATATQALSNDMIRFIHYLRTEGYAITSGETIATFRALEQLPLSNETEVCLGLRAVLCSTLEERNRFDRLFTAFFRGTAKQSGLGETANGERADHEEKAEKGTSETIETAIKTDAASEDSTEQVGRTVGSEGMSRKKEPSFLQAVQRSQAASKQFTSVHVSSDHYADMLKAARSLIRSVQLKPSRRWQPLPDGRRIDFRRTLRRSLGTGGCPIDPARSGHRLSKASFLLLCDGSRSMASYTGLFLQFAAALHRETPNTELFLFSTKARRVTPLLRKAYPPHMPSFAKLGAEWGGGTCIGEALTDVIQGDRSQLLSRDTVCMIFSDGLDSGDPVQLEQGMCALKRRVNCVIWLNPLLGQAGYEPLARGMHLALKHIDVFAEAHNAASFHKLPLHMRQRRGTG